MYKINQLVTYEKQLPNSFEDLSHFVIIGTEKLVAMKAEIRAITKCGFAKEVYEQKMEEQRMLSELILDASVKIGELTKALPKATEAKGNQFSGKWKNVTDVGNPISKTERIKELGFSPKQVERFEILANNKDVVEQVKAEARENDDIPTRSRVIDIVKQRKKDRDLAIENEKAGREIFKKYLDVIYGVLKFELDDSLAEIISHTPLSITDEIANIDTAITKLNAIKRIFIMKGGKKYGTS